MNKGVFISLLLLAVSFWSCVPNFNPEDSELGPIFVNVDISDFLLPSYEEDGFVLRLSLYCYDAATDSLAGRDEVLLIKGDESTRLAVTGLRRSGLYRFAVLADYEKRMSDTYNKQQWYHLFQDTGTGLLLERVSREPSEYDCVACFTTSMYPDETTVLVSPRYIGRKGKVIVENYDKVTDLTWHFDTAARFAPLNPSGIPKMVTVSSDKRESEIVFVTYGDAYMKFQLTTREYGNVTQYIDVNRYDPFTLVVDAVSGIIRVSGTGQ